MIDTWAAALYRSIRNFLTWPTFEPLVVKPPMQLPPMMSDDDVDFAGDMIYCRALLDHIWEDCHRNGLRAKLIPEEMSTALDAALILAGYDFLDGLAA